MKQLLNSALKNSADLGGCYPPRPKAEVDNALLDLRILHILQKPNSIIAKYNNVIIWLLV